MDTIGLVLAIVGGVLSFLTCRPASMPEGIVGAAACSAALHAAAEHRTVEAGAGAASGPRERAEARGEARLGDVGEARRLKKRSRTEIGG